MKIIITEIEANAEELKCSNTLAGSFSNMLRRAFMPTVQDSEEDEDESEEWNNVQNSSCRSDLIEPARHSGTGQAEAKGVEEHGQVQNNKLLSLL